MTMHDQVDGMMMKFLIVIYISNGHGYRLMTKRKQKTFKVMEPETKN